MKNHKSILKKGITLWVMTVLVTFSLTACGKEEYPSGTITLNTAKDRVGFVIRTDQNSRNLSVDWGDGKKSNVDDAIIDEFEQIWFIHEYSDITNRTIIITGVITHLNCNDNDLTFLDLSKIKTLVSLNCKNNKLTMLDVSANTALNLLECDFNQLTSLNVSKNKSLALLSCVGNQLSATALNDLFRSLPYKRGSDYNEGESGSIYISRRNPGSADNPGIFDCDRSIAEQKGWEFRTIRN